MLILFVQLFIITVLKKTVFCGFIILTLFKKVRK